ncbi:N-terminal acetyltransferase B complex auxiliary subunit NAA25-like isoform X3 [Papaver somniferum]|uniref:N-terminal acetyltransferase B complex auxiliary subunit NAA25-like isoform X3 n=1 Tax=Papaver somniferum TaxID=3469 RepID=UPI000E6F6A30|nr:N-terminal acetyltransferase B complex auxiliary subunit NAA25-like isoform X3 [Papaver somniferum]
MPGMLASPHLEDLGGVLRLYSGFMDHHLSDVRERTFDAYATGDHALAIKLGYFTRRLKTSHQYVISEVESMVLEVKHSVEKFGKLKEMKSWSEELQKQFIEKSKSVTLNDDPRSRPWWTPTPNVNHLKGTFDGENVVYKNRKQCESLRKSYWSRTIERRSLLLSLITYALQSPPVCGMKVFSNTSHKILKLHEINNKYLESLELTRDEALDLITKVAEGKPFENEKVDIISLMTYGVFSSEDTVQLDMVSRMISTFVADKLEDKQLPISFRGDDLALLSQIVAEPLAWMNLLFEVCIEFYGSKSKNLKRSNKELIGNTFIQSIKCLIGESTKIIDGIEAALNKELAVPSTGWQDFLSSGVKEKETGPGQFIKILETMCASSNLPTIQDVKREWSCKTVKGEILSAQRKTLEGILMICKSKNHLRALKKRKLQKCVLKL